MRQRIDDFRQNFCTFPSINLIKENYKLHERLMREVCAAKYAISSLQSRKRLGLRIGLEYFNIQEMSQDARNAFLDIYNEIK